MTHKKDEAAAGLSATPPPEKWDDWREYDPASWPRKVERRYSIVPTACFNCESACGLLAFVDQESGQIRKLEGNPYHPGSRGHLCAKGPATLAQVTNPDRILYPLRRTGERGEGKWERVTWDEALTDIAGRIRRALEEDRRDEIVYHVGRPGEDMYTERVLAAWGVDGHNSHTNVCSSSARVGYALWMGMDRPTPDHENADFILLLSSHLESGHYFQPQAQRIVAASARGAKIAVIDSRLSNTASQAHYWLAPWPGTESALLLAIARYLIENELYDRDFLRRWVNWQQLMNDEEYLAYLQEQGLLKAVPEERSFSAFLTLLREVYSPYTFEWAAQESRVAPDQIEAIAKEVGRAGAKFASHVWRNAAAGNLGGWMVARCLFLLNVLAGSVGTVGGTIPNYWAKFVPQPHSLPPPVRIWNEAHFPKEFPLAHFEMSFLLPYLLERQQRRLEVYFSRVYNPVWTNPDGLAWIDMFTRGDRIGLHVALTPVWSETAQYADYVLPMGMGPERHDLHSYETHGSQWLGFRQPVLRVARERKGESFKYTYEANPGEVWEENEFWMELSWRIDPDGALGIRKHFESPYRAGEKITIEEYYRWIFENSVPGLPQAASEAGLAPLEYMRRFGAFEVTRDVYSQQEKPVRSGYQGAIETQGGLAFADFVERGQNLRPYPGPFLDRDGKKMRVGVMVDGQVLQGFPTPSGRLEFFSPTMKDWGWTEYAIPIYPQAARQREEWQHLVSHVHWSRIDHAEDEYLLLPTFRLPALIHTRTNGAKWLYELSHINPVWIHPQDARRMGVKTGDLVKLESEIGYFIDRAWVTEGIRPGVVACSHHLGRWRRHEDHGSDRWNSALVDLQREGDEWTMRQLKGVTPFMSSDPDSQRIWWTDGGVHQNLIFPVQPDPVSGQHCWHQKVRVTKAPPESRYGDIHVDAGRARRAFERWLQLTRPGPGPNGQRRPYWMLRPLKPAREFYTSPPESL